jgi:hypothetical protein
MSAMRHSTKLDCWGGPIKRGNNRFAGSYHFRTSVNIFDQIEINPLEYLRRIVTTVGPTIRQLNLAILRQINFSAN